MIKCKTNHPNHYCWLGNLIDLFFVKLTLHSVFVFILYSVFEEEHVVHQNAFEVIMASQRQRSQKTMPDLIEQPRTGKQRLRNSIVTFLREKKCQWHGTDEVASQGQSFISALTDALWTIYGHHHVSATKVL